MLKLQKQGKNKEWDNWIELLCMYGDYNDYLEIEFNSISVPIAIMEYRSKLYQEGIEDVTLEQLQKANMNNEKKLQEVLERMFLEPIPYEHIKYFYESTAKRGYKNTTDAIKELYRRHKEDKGTRFISIALTI